MNDEDLLRALRALPPETEPPPDLEKRIAARLWPRRRTAPFLALSYSAAIAIAAFLGGYALARAQPEPTHILFVHRTQVTPAEASARVAEYRRWARDLAGGERLSRDAWMLEGARVDAGATPELSGYFLVHARDDAEALRIAKTCPHLRHGGRVELRRIQR